MDGDTHDRTDHVEFDDFLNLPDDDNEGETTGNGGNKDVSNLKIKLKLNITGDDLATEGKQLQNQNEKDTSSGVKAHITPPQRLIDGSSEADREKGQVGDQMVPANNAIPDTQNNRSVPGQGALKGEFERLAPYDFSKSTLVFVPAPLAGFTSLRNIDYEMQASNHHYTQPLNHSTSSVPFRQLDVSGGGADSLLSNGDANRDGVVRSSVNPDDEETMRRRILDLKEQTRLINSQLPNGMNSAFVSPHSETGNLSHPLQGGGNELHSTVYPAAPGLSSYMRPPVLDTNAQQPSRYLMPSGAIQQCPPFDPHNNQQHMLSSSFLHPMMEPLPTHSPPGYQSCSASSNVTSCPATSSLSANKGCSRSHVNHVRCLELLSPMSTPRRMQPTAQISNPGAATNLTASRHDHIQEDVSDDEMPLKMQMHRQELNKLSKRRRASTTNIEDEDFEPRNGSTIISQVTQPLPHEAAQCTSLISDTAAAAIDWTLPKFELQIQDRDPKDDSCMAKISLPNLVREEILLSLDHAEQEAHLLTTIFMPGQQMRATPDPEPAVAVLNFHTIAVMVIEAYVQFEIGDEFGLRPSLTGTSKNKLEDFERRHDAKDANVDEIFFAVIDRWRAGIESRKKSLELVRGVQEFCDVALDVIYHIKEHGLLKPKPKNRKSQKSAGSDATNETKSKGKTSKADGEDNKGTKRAASQKATTLRARKKPKTAKEAKPSARARPKKSTVLVTVTKR